MSDFAAALAEYNDAAEALAREPRVEPLEGGEDVVCRRHSVAIKNLLSMDAETLEDLRAKIEVYDREEIDDGWYLAREVTSKLAADARRLIAAPA